MALPTAQQLDALYPAIAPDAWTLDRDCVFLNHGSFGACPRPVLERQQELRDQLEANPLRFLVDTAPPLLDRSRAAMAGLFGVPSEDVVFVHNATAGVNAVLRSLDWQAGDEIVLLDHAYVPCANVVDYLARRHGIVPVRANIKWPGSSPSQVIDAIDAAVTPRTRLAMIDHVTSLSGLVIPIREVAELLHSRGVEVLVDGAHAPGMVDIDVPSLGVAYYVGNCHKWLCAPKSAAALYVRPDRQDAIEPEIVSEGSRFDPTGQSYGSFQQRFAWQGTSDPSAAICAADAIAFLSSLLPGGLSALMKRNHDMAVGLRRVICDAWDVPAPCPDDMIGSMAAMLIAPGYGRYDPWPAAQTQHAFIRSLRDERSIECQCMPFGNPPRLQARLSCQAYNHGSQVQAFIEIFRDRIDRSIYEV